jgi:DNA-binding NarL/FixJ family response regulator
MDCMLTGQPNKAVAHRLELSMRTVDRRRQAVLEKMGVRTAPELALLLGSAGITPPPISGDAVESAEAAFSE